MSDGIGPDLQAVLDVIVESAAKVCDAADAVIRLAHGDVSRLAAHYGSIPPMEEDDPIGRPGSWSGRAVLERRTIHVHDVQAEPVRLGRVRPGDPLRSVVATPLQREGEPLGVLNLRRTEVRPFTAEQIARLEAFARLAAVAVDDARLLREVGEKNRELAEALAHQSATAEVLNIIASSPTDVQPVLDAICASAARVCGATDTAIRLIVGDGLEIVARHGNLSRGAVGANRLPIDRLNTAGAALLDGRTVYVPDILAQDQFPGFKQRPRGIRSFASTPLVREGTGIGTIAMMAVGAAAFTDKQIQLLETFADQAVIAIENVRLFNEIQERNRLLTEALEQQTATADVLRIIASSPTELRPVLDAICERTVLVSGASDAYIRLVEGDQLVVGGVWGPHAGTILEEAARAPIRVTARDASRAFASKQSVHIDLSADRGERSRAPVAIAQAAGARTLLATPLLRGDEAVGLLGLLRPDPGPFTAKQVELVETFASQAVIAIENARLLEELEQKNHEVEVASQHKSDFLASMSHELRTPLNAIISFSEILEEDATDAGDDRYLADLQEINTAGKYLLGLINDILDLSKVEAGRMDLYLEDFEVADLVRDVVAVAQPLVEKNGNELQVEAADGLGQMHADRTKVRQCLLNLLSNAAKFTERGMVTLRIGGGGAILTFAVSDTGIGMTEDQVGRLFEAFSQADAATSQKYGGTGLGLAITRQFCQLMGGDVAVVSQPGKGSTFTITLPTVIAEPGAANQPR